MNESKVIIWCDRIIVFSFYALIYFLPISKALIEIWSTIIITTFFVKRGFLFWLGSKEAGERRSIGFFVKLFYGSFKPVDSSLNFLFGLFLLVNILSIIINPYWSLGIKGFVYKLFQGVVLFYAFIECMKTKKQIKIFTMIMIIGGTLITTSGLLQFYQGKGIIHGHTLVDGRVVSAFEHPNDLGGYLVIVTMVLLCLVLHVVLRWKPHQGKHRLVNKLLIVAGEIFLISLSLAFVLCFELTFSRSAWLGFFAALLFVGLIKREFLFICIGILIFFLMLSIPQLKTIRNVSFLSDDVMHDEPINFKEKVNEYFNAPEMNAEADHKEAAQGEERVPAGIFSRNVSSDLSRLKSLALKILLDFKKFIICDFGGMGRMGFWEEAIGMIKDSPFLGVGLNAYSKVAPKYFVNWGGYPHNCFLHMAAETGFIGLFVFLWLLGSIFHIAFRGIAKAQDGYLQVLLLGATSGYGAFLIQSFFDTNFYSVKLGVFMWVIMGLIVAVEKLSLCSKENQKKKKTGFC